MATAFANQITNRNFLSPAAFQFNITKVPKVSFFCSSASIPSISLETNTQSSYLKDIDVPGEKLDYENLNLRFLVDEDLKNYMAIHNWMTGLGFPESTKDFKDEVTKPDTSYTKDKKETTINENGPTDFQGIADILGCMFAPHTCESK